jgi:hypothetical protein
MLRPNVRTVPPLYFIYRKSSWLFNSAGVRGRGAFFSSTARVRTYGIFSAKSTGYEFSRGIVTLLCMKLSLVSWSVCYSNIPLLMINFHGVISILVILLKEFDSFLYLFLLCHDHFAKESLFQQFFSAFSLLLCPRAIICHLRPTFTLFQHLLFSKENMSLCYFFTKDFTLL